jgi:hypothetical protein
LTGAFPGQVVASVGWTPNFCAAADKVASLFGEAIAELDEEDVEDEELGADEELAAGEEDEPEGIALLFDLEPQLERTKTIDTITNSFNRSSFHRLFFIVLPQRLIQNNSLNT